MDWKRHEITSILCIGRLHRLRWFWRYVLWKRPLIMSVIMMVREPYGVDTSLFIEDVTIVEESEEIREPPRIKI